MSTYHWSFCGSTYAEAVTKKWRDNGIYANLDRKMGYRYELVSASLPQTVKQGGTTSVELRIKNVGYAPLYNARPVYVVLKNQQSVVRVPLVSDPRRWLPNGETTVISETVTIPKDVPVGTYDLYLYMPDAYASIADDPRYAIRFANVGTWDAETGMNRLNASMQVTAGATAIETVNNVESNGQKILRNGQLYIRKADKVYTLMGQEVKR